jgi:hypothetical protein
MTVRALSKVHLPGALWSFPTFPQICLPDVSIPTTRMPTSIAWGEHCATEADANVQSMTDRPHTPSH